MKDYSKKVKKPDDDITFDDDIDISEAMDIQ